jgi:hypothetical protein
MLAVCGSAMEFNRDIDYGAEKAGSKARIRAGLAPSASGIPVFANQGPQLVGTHRRCLRRT